MYSKRSFLALSVLTFLLSSIPLMARATSAFPTDIVVAPNLIANPVVNDQVTGWTVGGGYIYYRNCLAPAPLPLQAAASDRGYIRRVPVQGGSVISLLEISIPNECDPWPMAADESGLYLVNGKYAPYSGLYKYLVGSPNQPILLNSSARFPFSTVYVDSVIALDGDNVYVEFNNLIGQQIGRVPKAGGDFIPIANLPSGTSYVLADVNAGVISWLDNHGLWIVDTRCTPTTCNPQVNSIVANANAFVREQDNLYYVNTGAGIKRLTCMFGICTEQILYTASAGNFTTGLTIRNELLYFIENHVTQPAPNAVGSEDGQLKRISINGAIPETVLDHVPYNPSYIGDTPWQAGYRNPLFSDNLGVYTDLTSYSFGSSRIGNYPPNISRISEITSRILLPVAIR